MKGGFFSDLLNIITGGGKKKSKKIRKTKKGGQTDSVPEYNGPPPDVGFGNCGPFGDGLDENGRQLPEAVYSNGDVKRCGGGAKKKAKKPKK